MKQNFFKTPLISMAISTLLLSCTTAVSNNKKAHENISTQPIDFKGFDIVTKDSKGLKRTSLPSAGTKQTKRPYARMALNLEYKGTALADPNYFYWCSSAIEVDKKIHFFASRWPASNGMGGWTSVSEIVHFVADHPEGPFKYVRTIFNNDSFKGTPFKSPHNPRIQAVDGKFMLCYSVQKHAGQKRQMIVAMAVADSIDGEFHFAGGRSGGVLWDQWPVAPEDSINDYHTPAAEKGCANPTFLKVGNEYRYYLSHHSAIKGHGNDYSMAVSDQLEGPYKLKGRVLDNISYVEDAMAFEMNGTYYMLVDDNKGGNGGISGGQVLWKSDDGISFKYEDVVISSGPVFDYWGGTEAERKALMKTDPFCRSTTGKFERPAFLLQDGKPTYYYAVSGVNIHGGKTSEICVLKIHE